MFNFGIKKDLRKRRDNQYRLNNGRDEQVVTQVRKILEQKGQGLILMARG